jgi:hypothetical protein
MTQYAFTSYMHYGTLAERLAFVPVPSPGQPIYIWKETNTGNTYLYDTSWHLIAGTVVDANVLNPFLLMGA